MWNCYIFEELDMTRLGEALYVFSNSVIIAFKVPKLISKKNLSLVILDYLN